jgi:hypothetical protein
VVEKNDERRQLNFHFFDKKKARSATKNAERAFFLKNKGPNLSTKISKNKSNFAAEINTIL